MSKETATPELVDESTEITVSGLGTQKEVLAVYTSENGLNEQVNQVKDLVDNFEHNMANLKGRNLTKSLSAKIGKFKAKLEKTGKALADNEKAKIEDVQATVKLINKNVKDMGDALAQLKVEARKPLTDWELAKKEKDRLKAEKEATEKMDLLHENGLFMNKEFDAEKVEAEKAKAEQAEKDRIAREKEIADQAILDEKRKAQNLKRENELNEQRLIKEKEEAEAKAIHYWYHAESDDCGFVVGNVERDKIHTSVAEICTKEVYDKCMQDKADHAKREQEKIDAENLRIKNENIAKQQQLEKEQREAQRVIDDAKRVEQERIAQQQKDEQLRLNNQYIAQVCGDLKQSIMQVGGVSEPQAKAIVIGLRDGAIDTADFNQLFIR